LYGIQNTTFFAIFQHHYVIAGMPASYPAAGGQVCFPAFPARSAAPAFYFSLFTTFSALPITYCL
jgi:hypothetical protein